MAQQEHCPLQHHQNRSSQQNPTRNAARQHWNRAPRIKTGHRVIINSIRITSSKEQPSEKRGVTPAENHALPAERIRVRQILSLHRNRSVALLQTKLDVSAAHRRDRQRAGLKASQRQTDSAR
eukprot:1029010-Rhodomonas_salina.1